MATADIAEWRGSSDVASDSELKSWLDEAPGTQRTLPWEADPAGMAYLGGFDTAGQPLPAGAPAGGIVFGAADSAEAGYVSNWVLVDDLGGLGKLYCGSYGGKFYLSTTAGVSGQEAALAPAGSGEECGMAAVCQCVEGGGAPLAGGTPLLPRQACPMSMREQLLKVNGKWRSDVWWDTLINGCLAPYPPGTRGTATFTNRFRYFTLRLVQVGRWLCFHTVISEPQVDITCDNDGNVTDYEVEASQYYDIGYSGQWHGLPRPMWGSWFWSGFAENDGTAEPPWGKSISDSWQGDDSTALAAAPTAYDGSGCCGAAIAEDGLTGGTFSGGYQYCRIYPRINASCGWPAYHQNDPATLNDDDEQLEDYLFGISPEWCEERLGISDYYLRGGEEDWQDCGIPDHSCYRGITSPAAEFELIFEARLPLSAIGNTNKGTVYLAFYAASIDGCVLTASICAPYGYMNDVT